MSVVHKPIWQASFFEELFEATVLQLFKQLSCPVDRVAPGKQIEKPETMSCAVLGFTSSNADVTVILAASADLLSATYPGSEPGPSWVGELTNLLVGRFKNDLWTVGAEEISLGFPLVLGWHMMPLIQRAAEIPAARHYVGSRASEQLYLWCDGDVRGPLAVDGVIKPRQAHDDYVEPGGIRYFG